MSNHPSVCVITAATGHPNLSKCIRAVLDQTYAMVEHLVVVDGPEWRERVDRQIDALPDKHGLSLFHLPQPTGKNGWNGHCIYGSMPLLVSADFVCYLDEDNWFDEEHIETLVKEITEANALWGFSLRKIVDKAGRFVTLDQCESLGNLHYVYSETRKFHHIDTSCYMLKRELAVQLSGVWNRPALPPKGQGPGPDSLLCQVLMHNHPNGPCTRKYTLNYTVGSNVDSAKADYFIFGNQMMKKWYPRGMPWEPQRV